MPHFAWVCASFLARLAMAAVPPGAAASGGSSSLALASSGSGMVDGGQRGGSLSLVGGCYSLFRGMSGDQMLHNERTGEVARLPSGAEWFLGEDDGLDFVYRGDEDRMCRLFSPSSLPHARFPMCLVGIGSGLGCAPLGRVHGGSSGSSKRCCVRLSLAMLVRMSCACSSQP